MAGQPRQTKVFEAERGAPNTREFLPEAEYLPRPAPRVLDIGCGGGDLACFLAPNAGEVVALDLSPGVLRAVQAKKDAKGLERLRVVAADLTHLPFRDGSFDYVVSRYALHHSDLEQSLPEIRRVLAAGGRLFLRDIYAPLPALERWTGWQVFKVLIVSALHAYGRGLRSGWRYFRFNVSRRSLDHMLYQNRLEDWATYRSLHRRYFPGCRFRRLRTRLMFWDAPALWWEKPASPAAPDR